MPISPPWLPRGSYASWSSVRIPFSTYSAAYLDPATGSGGQPSTRAASHSRLRARSRAASRADGGGGARLTPSDMQIALGELFGLDETSFVGSDALGVLASAFEPYVCTPGRQFSGSDFADRWLSWFGRGRRPKHALIVVGMQRDFIDLQVSPTHLPRPSPSTALHDLPPPSIALHRPP